MRPLSFRSLILEYHDCRDHDGCGVFRSTYRAIKFWLTGRGVR